MVVARGCRLPVGIGVRHQEVDIPPAATAVSPDRLMAVI